MKKSIFLVAACSLLVGVAAIAGTTDKFSPSADQILRAISANDVTVRLGDDHPIQSIKLNADGVVGISSIVCQLPVDASQSQPSVGDMSCDYSKRYTGAPGKISDEISDLKGILSQTQLKVELGAQYSISSIERSETGIYKITAGSCYVEATASNVSTMKSYFVSNLMCNY